MSAFLALQDHREVRECPDYRNIPIMSAPARSYGVESGVGIALELDTAEFMQPVIDTAIMIGCFAVGMVAGCTVVLVAVTKRFLRSMITAKEEGRRAVGVEKDRFSKLVATMYPTYVLPRLLEGERQMVCEIPGAAVFFSDIHRFTSASNTLGSQELLQLMGYVYGVMDDVATRFGVYKVKTIGDAYLALCGLPGAESENPSLDLLRFASCVAQVFSTQYVHPAEGEVLAVMNRAMEANELLPKTSSLRSISSLHSLPSFSKQAGGPPGRPRGNAPRVKASIAPSVARTHKRSVASAVAADAEANVQCVMSYGLATGRLVAGVLAGRCPMFDIWGGTVNLASRMQSTGEPGRIQVSEQVYKKVISVPGQPFTFDAPRGTFCKGFGTVHAYMVRATTEGLPPDLEALLRLEPRFGPFSFDFSLASAPPRRDVPVAPAGRMPPTPALDTPLEVLDV
eukprot:EG_transcript_7735